MGERIKKSIQLLTALIVLMAFGYAVHYLYNPFVKTFLIQSYLINSFLAFIALVLLEWGIHKKKNNLALLYLATVALKFITYFLFFHPRFQLDGVLNRQEFFIFFAPYSLGLLFEIILLARRYN